MKQLKIYSVHLVQGLKRMTIFSSDEIPEEAYSNNDPRCIKLQGVRINCENKKVAEKEYRLLYDLFGWALDSIEWEDDD